MVNRLNLLLVLTLVLGLLAAGVFWYSHSWSTIRAGDSDFSLDRSLEVLKIEILAVQTQDSVTMVKDVQQRWVLNNHFFANEPAVNELLSAMQRLQVRQPVSMESSHRVQQMLNEEAVLVNIYVLAYRIQLGNLRLLPYQRLYQSIKVGADTSDGQSTYMRKSRSNKAFKVHIPAYDGGLAYFFVPEEREWRNPVIADLERREIISVKVIVPNNSEESFLLQSAGNSNFAFINIETGKNFDRLAFDTARVHRFLSSFNDIHYESLLDEEADLFRKNNMFEQPFMIISVESISGVRVGMEAFARQPQPDDLAVNPEITRDPNRFYVRVNQGEYALAQYYVFNRILRPLSFFTN